MRARIVAFAFAIATLFACALAYAPASAHAASGGILPGEPFRRTLGSISAGCSHTLVRQPDGLVTAFGANTNGQLGNNTTSDSASAVVVVRSDGLPLQNIIAVAAGCNFSLALDSDGSVWSWGANASRQLGNNTSTTDRPYADKVLRAAGTPLGSISSISAGPTWGLAVSADGKALAWGANSWRQLGRGSGADSGLALPMKAGTGASCTGGTSADLDFVVAVAGGMRGTSQAQSMILKSDGNVYLVGDTSGTYSCPARFDGGGFGPLTNVKAIAAGGTPGSSWHQVALKSNGEVWARGSNGSGQLGWGSSNSGVDFLRVVTQQNIPIFNPNPPPLANIVAIDAGGDHTIAVDAGGVVWSWGSGVYGQNGLSSDVTYAVPVERSVGVTLNGQMAVAAGANHSVTMDAQSRIRTFGRNASGQLGDGTTTNRRLADFASSYTPPIAFVQAVGKSANTQLLRSDGKLFTTGNDSYGSLGDGTGVTGNTDRFVPNALAGGYRARYLADGSAWGYLMGALDEVGRPQAWGSNVWGGVGTNQIPGNDSQNVFAPRCQWTAVNTCAGNGFWSTTGEFLSGFATGDGYAFYTGGDSCSSDSAGAQDGLLKVQNPNVKVTSVSAGRRHKVARIGDGTVVSCGFNGDGPLGTQNYNDSYSWIAMAWASNISQAIAGDWSTHINSGDGSVWGVGRNWDEDLGIGKWRVDGAKYFSIQKTSYSGGGVVARALANGLGATGAAIKPDGTLISWGLNATNGQACNGGTSASQWALNTVGVGNLWNVSMGSYDLVGVRANGIPFFCGTPGVGMAGACGAVGNTLTPATMGCRPVGAPTITGQYEADGATSIPTGAWTGSGAVEPIRLRFTGRDQDDDDWLQPWVEIIPNGSSYGSTQCGAYTATTYAGSQINAVTKNVSYTLEVPVTGLAGTTLYKWRACFVDAFGNATGWTNASTTFRIDDTAPVRSPVGPVTGTATVQSMTQIDWTLDGSYTDAQSGMPAAAYSFDGGATWGAAQSYSRSDYAPNSLQSVQLSVRNNARVRTPNVTVSAWTQAGAPVAGSAVSGWTSTDGNNVQLTWTPHAGGAGGYNVYSDVTGYVTPIATAASGATSVVAGSLAPNATYTMRVCPLNGGMVESPNCATWPARTTPPAAPSAISADASAAADTVTFTWTNPPGATATRVRIFTDAACASMVSSTDPATSPLVRTGLSADTAYWYRIDSFSTASGAWGASACTPLTGNGRTMLNVRSIAPITGLSVVAGSSITGSTAIDVDTNAATGYSLSVRARGEMTDGTNTIPMISGAAIGSPLGSGATTSPGDGVAFTIAGADHTGAGENWQSGTAWAPIPVAPSAAATMHTTGTGAFVAGARTTRTTMGVRLAAPTGTPPGTYSMTLDVYVVPLS